MKPKVCVIGSINKDHNLYVEHLPKVGETVSNLSFFSTYGGKGFNQAVTAARMDCEVTFLGAVGDDLHGRSFLDVFHEEEIKSQYISLSEERTGQSWILIENSGKNMIIYDAGANFTFAPDDVIKAREAIENADMVLAQLEVPVSCVNQAFSIAREMGVTTVLNPAPARGVCEELLTLTDILIPNETELMSIVGDVDFCDEKALYKKVEPLFDKGIRQVVVTLGEMGAMAASKDRYALVPAAPAKAIDTTAAGDSFIGAYIHQLAQGITPEQAVEKANYIASLVIQRKGAYISIPPKNKIGELKKERLIF